MKCTCSGFSEANGTEHRLNMNGSQVYREKEFTFEISFLIV